MSRSGLTVRYGATPRVGRSNVGSMTAAKNERPASGEGYDAIDHGPVEVEPGEQERLEQERLEQLHEAGFY